MTSHIRWLNDVQQDLWRKWLHTHTSFNIALGRQLAKDSGLTLAEYEVLVALSEAPDRRLRMAVLAEKMQWDRSRLSHQITRMANRALVCRSSCPEDGRGAFVELAPEGLEAIREAAPGHVAQVRELLFHQLTAEEALQLRAILNKIDAQFQD